jgi:NitT/TauT family transport system substrate-binding protein
MNILTRTIFYAALTPVLLGTAVWPTPVRADDKITVQMGWTAEAEQGGIYQAHGAGIYKKYGLDVTIRQGGPQINTAQLLAAGAIDFTFGINDSTAFNFVQSGAPGIAIAALHQKDVTILIAHPDVGIKTMADMKGHPIALARNNLDTWWPLLKTKYGFTDDQIRPYTFQLAPFLLDKNLVQVGVVTSEPYELKKEADLSPKIFMISDEGYDTYSSIILTSPTMVATKPDLVQRFVDASIEGWYGYIYGDPTPGNDEIRAADPTMTLDHIEDARGKLKDFHVVDDGDTLQLGIGAMTDARWKSLFVKLVSFGLYPADMDYKKAFTLQFVNKGHGLALRK